MEMQKSRSWKKADYPNRKPAWQKKRVKDPLKDWMSTRGFADTKILAKGMERALKVFGNKTKIVKTYSGYKVYYQKILN